MDIRNNTKNILPHLVAVILFTVISFAYFYPVLEGKVLKANDSTVSRINSKEIQDYRDKYGKEPLWTNSIFSGMPAYLISTKYPGNLFKYVDTVLRQYKMPVSVLFLSMLGFYILLIIFGLNPWLSIVGAIAYGLTSFFFQILGAGHNTQAIALAYMPPMIGSIYYAYRRNAIVGGLLTAFFLALEIQANHPQITYYAFLCLLVFGIVELIYAIKGGSLDKFLKTSAILIIPVVLAIGINFASLYTTWEYGKYSIRGKSDLTTANKKPSSGLDKDYITYWSYGVDETFNMLIPDYKGGSSKPFDRDSETVKALRQNNAADAVNQLGKYWGTQPGTDGPHYIGAIVFFLFVLGLLVVKGPEKWWLLSATVLSVMLAWGKNFMPLSDLFINFFPGYNKFRAVTMILVIAEFCMPLLGFLALRDIFNGKLGRDEVLKNLKFAAGITGGFTLLVLIIPGIAGSFLSPYEAGFPNWLKTTLIADRKALLRADSFRSLIFILLGAGVIFAWLKNKLKTNQSVVILGILILIDLWVVDKRYLNSDRFDRSTGMSNVFIPTTADKYIMNDPSDNRVLNLTVSTFNDNSPTSYFHHSIGGYHGAKMKRYQELIDSVLNRNIDLMRFTANNSKTIEEFQTVFSKAQALNMLNTKYVIYNPESAPLVNDKALGNAWFVENPVIVQNANEELASVSNFDPASQAIIDKKFSSLITKSSYPTAPGDTIKLSSYQPNELVYNYTAADEKLIVFSEIYYPAGWKCFIDGKETEYFRADYVLRAMIAPAGSHEIRFKFEPASYITGNKISLASSIVLILIILGYFGTGIYKRVSEKA
jgi:hypothetical protein